MANHPGTVLAGGGRAVLVAVEQSARTIDEHGPTSGQRIRRGGAAGEPALEASVAGMNMDNKVQDHTKL